MSPDSHNPAGLATLENLHQSPSDSLHIGAKEEFVQIQAQLQLERKESAGNIFSLLKNKRYRKRLLTGFMLQVVTQTTGVLVINNYMVRLVSFEPCAEHLPTFPDSRACRPRCHRMVASHDQRDLQQLGRGAKHRQCLYRRSLWAYPDHHPGNSKFFFQHTSQSGFLTLYYSPEAFSVSSWSPP